MNLFAIGGRLLKPHSSSHSNLYSYTPYSNNLPSLHAVAHGGAAERHYPRSLEWLPFTWNTFMILTHANNFSSRLSQSCIKKCIPKDYREGELNKGEGVCIDRCASKFFDVQMKISELLQAEAAAKGAGGGGFGGGGFGM